VQHPRLVLVGRSSSSFTRVARVFAAEAGIAYEFQVVRDLTSLDPNDYGGNPALKIPSLRAADGDWYGALAVCRELVRRSSRPLRVVWPEDFRDPRLSNTQELVLHAMATEVNLIMTKPEGDRARDQDKRTRSLTGTLAWLESHAPAALTALPPDRDLSFLEVTLYCLLRHLEFRKVLPVTPYAQLASFCLSFESRDSVRTSEFKYDT
jgi:glutathione S-transferase